MSWRQVSWSPVGARPVCDNSDVSVLFPRVDAVIVDGVGGWIWGDDCQDDLRSELVDLICGRAMCRFVTGVCGLDNQVRRERIPKV